MKSKTYFSQDLQHKVFSKHKTFATHFSLSSGTPVCCGTQFGNTALAHPHFAVVNCCDALTMVFYSPVLTRSLLFLQL